VADTYLCKWCLAKINADLLIVCEEFYVEREFSAVIVIFNEYSPGLTMRDIVTAWGWKTGTEEWRTGKWANAQRI
jgi:hypothetical protein